MRYFFICLICFQFFTEVKSSPNQSDCQILNYATEIRIEKGRKIETISYLIEVNNNDGDWISEIKIPFSKGNKVDILEAVILDKDNQIKRKLKKGDVVTKSDIDDGTFYDDHMVKEFTLKWSQYPYRIRYSYKATYDEFLYLADWSPMVFRSIPTSEATLDILVSKNYQLLMNYPDSIIYNQTSEDDIVRHNWKAAYKKEIETEVLAPNFYDCISGVQVVPKDFKFIVNGSFETWKSFGDWQFDIIRLLDQLTESEKKKVDELIVGIQDKEEIIRILYNYLQDNTRYINVSIETGGMVPYSAEYVCENKYGDCKALTIYMKALLNYVGIESYYTLIYGDEKPTRIIEAFPSQQFNHVILCVPFKEDTIWLENTSQYTPFNYLGTFTQNRKALLIKKNASKLVNTPRLVKSDVQEKSTYHFKINEDGEGELVLEQKLGGSALELLRYVDIQYSDRDKMKFFSRRKPLQKSELEKYEIQYKRNDKVLNYYADYKLVDQVRKIGSMYAIQLNPSIDFSLESKESRQQDILISYPINRSDSIIYTYSIPFECQVKLPEEVVIKTEYGSYSEIFNISDDRITAKRNFILNQGYYTIAKYPSFFDFITSIEKAQKKSVLILKPK